MASETIVEFRRVSKAFGERVVFDDMSLAIQRGETLAIIGGSGQGKSVCLKMSIGLLRPDRGEVLFRGEDVARRDAQGLAALRRSVAYVFQGGALFDSMTVGANVGYALREHTHQADAEIEARARECLALVGLDPDLVDAMPASLSGGMRKRVALARAIALPPDVILYDEPTTGLDPKNVSRIGDLIMALQRELQVTSIVVTHDMAIAFKVANRIAMLYEKRFPFCGSTDEMRTHPDRRVSEFIRGTIGARPPTSPRPAQEL